MSGITNPAEVYFKDGIWTWDGSAWLKQPPIFGYSDEWSESKIATAVGAASATASTTAVDPGYIYVFQGASIFHDAGANKELTLTANKGGVGVILFNDLAAVTGTWYPVICEITLHEGDTISGSVGTPGDGKRCLLRVGGYKMKIAE